MNIGIDIRALDEYRLTGVGNYILNSIENIIKLDKENQYYLLNTGLKNKDRVINVEQDNLHYIHLKYPNKLLNFNLAMKIGKGLSSYFPVKLDLLWLPNINFYHNTGNIPFILTIHDLSFLHSKSFYSLKRRLWHKMVKVRSLINKADKIISVSDSTKRDIMRFFNIREDKIKVINPGINCNIIDREKAKDLIKPFNISKKYFIYVGTLEPRKNIQAIIKAFDKYHKEYNDVDLVVVGKRGWLYYNTLKDIKKRKYIKYLDYISGKEKDALYTLSLGLVWPSFYEGYGFPPLEATFHHIPVILSYKTSLPEVMKQQGIYVDPYNSSDIYMAMKNLTEDKDLRDSLIQSAKEFILPKWDKKSEEIIHLFKNIK